MLKGGAQNVAADVAQVVDQLERHCLAPDGSLVSKSTYFELQLAREEMLKERQRYLESMAIYIEAMAMVEEYQQASLGGSRGLRIKNTQVYQTLEHRMIVAEASQRLRLPLISKDSSEIQEESSLDSYAPPLIGGVPDRYLGLTPAYLWHAQLRQTPLFMDMGEYQIYLSREIGYRLDAKCDDVADAVAIEDIDSSTANQTSIARLPERVKLIIEDIDREEEAWREDLHSSHIKFVEYFNVFEQILSVLIKLVKDIKLQHQHKYDELQKTWLIKRCETMNAKLRVLEHILLLETYSGESVAALHKIRDYLIEALEEASVAYNKAVTRLREYQGVDPHFDQIASQYEEIVKNLEYVQATIKEVEDFKPSN